MGCASSTANVLPQDVSPATRVRGPRTPVGESHDPSGTAAAASASPNETDPSSGAPAPLSQIVPSSQAGVASQPVTPLSAGGDEANPALDSAGAVVGGGGSAFQPVISTGVLATRSSGGWPAPRRSARRAHEDGSVEAHLASALAAAGVDSQPVSRASAGATTPVTRVEKPRSHAHHSLRVKPHHSARLSGTGASSSPVGSPGAKHRTHATPTPGEDGHAAWPAAGSATAVRSLRSKTGKSVARGTATGGGAGTTVSQQDRTLGLGGDRMIERSAVTSQLGLHSGYGGWHSFGGDVGGGAVEASILGDRSQVLRELEEEIIDRRHPPGSRGSRLVPTGGRASPSLSPAEHDDPEHEHEASHTHTYTYHTLISHTRAGVDAEEERMRERARDAAEEERERRLAVRIGGGRGASITGGGGREEALYDRSQVINTSAYGYAHHTTRTAYHAPSALHSYAAAYHRADSPLIDALDDYADVVVSRAEGTLEVEVDPYDSPKVGGGGGGGWPASTGGRVSVTASTPLPEEKETTDAYSNAYAGTHALSTGSGSARRAPNECDEAHAQSSRSDRAHASPAPSPMRLSVARPPLSGRSSRNSDIHLPAAVAT